MIIERKYERDIDLLLAEEFSVSPEFANWFLSRTKFNGDRGAVSEVYVSKFDALGESDLVVMYSLQDRRRIALMIENKIDAQLQYKQVDRYRMRGDLDRQNNDVDAFQIILCAPANYASAHPETSEFDDFISYEDIGDSILTIDGSRRGRYRAEFIKLAASRSQNRWVREQDDNTDQFWDGVYELASREFPILEMRRPQMTKNSNWITLRPQFMPTMPKHVYVSLKGSVGPRLRKSCCVDLTFGNTTAHRFASSVRSLLCEGMTVHQTGGAAAIRLEQPSFNVEEGFASALPKVQTALRAAALLAEFYSANRALLDAAAYEATPT